MTWKTFFTSFIILIALNYLSPIVVTAVAQSTPEAVINIADYGGCGTANDVTNINSALSAARTSASYTSGRPVRVVGGFSTTGQACNITGSVNATGFRNFNNGSKLIIADLVLTCSGTGVICLDTLGSLNIRFDHLTIVGNAIGNTPPMIGLQQGNYAPASTACCIQESHDLEVTGHFTFTAVYNAASESTTHVYPIFENEGASLGVIGALGAVSGGAGYVNGIYHNVPLTGSATGYGALANITVASGAVSNVSVTNQGKQYAVGDTVSASASALGGSGAGFSVPVSNVGQFAYVMDGQNHWGLSSSFVTVVWPADTYYTFTEDNVFSGSFRYYGTGNGAPLWMGSVVGANFVHVYGRVSLAPGPCTYLFDNAATNSVGNRDNKLGIQCETAGNNVLGYDVELTGSNPTPNISGIQLTDEQSTAFTAFLALDAGITSVTAHNAKIDLGRSTNNQSTNNQIPLFQIGTAQLWNMDGEATLSAIAQFNAPNGSGIAGTAQGVQLSNDGPLDILSPAANPIGVAGAYSCARRLSQYYGGPLCNIRRGSDGTAIDFYPNAAGVFDRTALNVFCANTSCSITTEYDQTGNGHDAVNSNTSTQPKVVLETGMNGAVCGSWGSVSGTYLSVAQNSAINDLFYSGGSGGFASSVTNVTNVPSGINRIFSKTATYGWILDGGGTSFNQPRLQIFASGTSGNYRAISSYGLGPHVFDASINALAPSPIAIIGLDGVNLSLGVQTAPSGALDDTTASLFLGNGNAGTQTWVGDICEGILYRQLPNALQIEAVRRNQAVFYGLSGVQ